MTKKPRAKCPGGFTLIELTVVILIIGLLLTFVMAASFAGMESARVRSTQSLITKLSVGIEDRLEALLATQPTVSGGHSFLASINPPGFAAGLSPIPWGLQSPQRAQVIARLEQIRANFPDVFYIDPAVAGDPAGSNKGRYPIQFAGLPYPNPADSTLNPVAGSANYVYPLGNTLTLYLPNSAYQPGGPITNIGPGGFIPGVTIPAGTGINGADYQAAAALYKLIGYTQKGCDGVDNNGDGFVDEFLEGTSDPNENSGGNSEAQAKIINFFTNHTHKTARAEMLYAILVEGQGPLGSVFNREDFKDDQVRDTDNDGVPEFVDAWGEPLQFYRWPFAHISDVQKGNSTYNSAFEVRERMPLDQNGQLTALAWWSSNPTTNPAPLSGKCQAIQNYFGPLSDPFFGAVASQFLWDRSGASARRAFSTKFLIVSGGPDREVGIPRLSDFEIKNTSRFSSHTLAQAITGTVEQSAGGITILPGESWALKLPYQDSLLPPWAMPSGSMPYEPALSTDSDYSLDDLSNHNLQTKAGGFQ